VFPAVRVQLVDSQVPEVPSLHWVDLTIAFTTWEASLATVIVAITALYACAILFKKPIN
jgi:hypothetical protein